MNSHGDLLVADTDFGRVLYLSHRRALRALLQQVGRIGEKPSKGDPLEILTRLGHNILNKVISFV